MHAKLLSVADQSLNCDLFILSYDYGIRVHLLHFLVLRHHLGVFHAKQKHYILDL